MMTARMRPMTKTRMTMNLTFCHHIFLLSCLDFALNLMECMDRSSVYHPWKGDRGGAQEE